LWPAEGRLRPWIIAQDRRFIGVSGLSATAAAAIMSALQQSPICGLEEPEIPFIAAKPARDIAPRDKTCQTGGVIPWQLAVAARAKLGILRARLLRRRL